MSDSLKPHGLQPTRLLCPWISPGKNTGVSCHSLLQRIFQTLGPSPGLLCCRQILYCLSHHGNPLIIIPSLFISCSKTASNSFKCNLWTNHNCVLGKVLSDHNSIVNYLSTMITLSVINSINKGIPALYQILFQVQELEQCIKHKNLSSLEFWSLISIVSF